MAGKRRFLWSSILSFKLTKHSQYDSTFGVDALDSPKTSASIANLHRSGKYLVDGHTTKQSTGATGRSGQISTRLPEARCSMTSQRDPGESHITQRSIEYCLEVIRSSRTAKGFEVLPRRWVNERTFGRMIRWRRLVEDCEQRTGVAKAMIYIAMGKLMLRRTAHSRITKRALRRIS